MKIAAAQIEVTLGDLKRNLKKHLELIEVAIENGVDLIVFPEMSLTGYCREEGKELATPQSSPELVELSKKAVLNNLVIVIGAPILIDGNLYIGSYILMQNGDIKIYTKQFLHAGEEIYYSSSFRFNPKLELKGETIQFAICADIDNQQHPLNAKENDCSLYIASLFFSKNGISKGHKILSTYAKRHALYILMSNYSGEAWGMKSGGKSGFWDNRGKFIAELAMEDEGLLIMNRAEGIWTSEKFIAKENRPTIPS